MQRFDEIKSALNLSKDAEVDEVCAGSVNRVFRLKDTSGMYAIKFIADSAITGVDVQAQVILQKSLADRGLAPRHVWLSHDKTIWVEEWIAEKRINLQDQVLSILARALVTIHNANIAHNYPILNLAKRWRQYIKSADNLSLALLEKVDSNMEHLAKLEFTNKDFCLCHNDLSVGHIIDTQRPIIVDWEYAAFGNRYFDLVSCANINNLSASQAAELCKLYSEFSGLDIKEVNEGYSNYIDIVELTNMLWFAAVNSSDSEN